MAIVLTALTTGEAAGRGAFDELMRSTKSHLLQEFAAGRISGVEYSQVYLGSLQSAMSQSLQFVLGAGVTSRQEELLAEQAKQVIEQTLLTRSQVALSTKQETLADKEILIADEKLRQAKQQVLLLTAQVAKTNQDVIATQEQIKTMKQQTLKLVQDTALATQEVLNAVTQNITMLKQHVKLDAEAAILVQKKYTEQAQTMDTVNSSPVTGMVGMQKTLYQRQGEGFLRDSEQKVAKMFLDTWSVRRTTDNNALVPTEMNDPAINGVLVKVKAGIGVT